MPRRGIVLGAVGVALLLAANVFVYQQRLRAAGPGSPLQAQVRDVAEARVASIVLEGSAPPLSPPPPQTPRTPQTQTPQTPNLPQTQSRPPPRPSAPTLMAPPVQTGTPTRSSSPSDAVLASSNGCPAGMQSATDPALASDPSTDCKTRHTFANGIQACYDHVRFQQGRYRRVNLHEPSEEELLARALSLIRPGDAFVDVGAAVGYYALLVASTHPESLVYGFNPSEWFRKQMAHNIRLNFGGRSGPPDGAAICIEPRSLGLTDGSLSYINGEYGGRAAETSVSREHVEIATGRREQHQSSEH